MTVSFVHRAMLGVYIATTLAFDVVAAAPAAGQAVTVEKDVRRFVSRHQGTFSGRKLSYQVIAADTLLKDAAGEPNGSIFSFSYLAEGEAATARPVTFVFNGGPGSASLWLHLGIGPKRLALADPKPKVTPPYRLVDNPESPLAVSDLVFVDPVGTGFSRLLGKGAPADFFGNNQDTSSVAQFIEQWLTEHRRWDSPKFLLGESYGTVRASLLTAALQEGGGAQALRGIALNGLILIGHDAGMVPLESETRFRTNFTTMAATAWYHNRVNHAGRTFDEFIDAARDFAAKEFAPALARTAGANLDEAELTRLSTRMSEFVGLSPEYLRANNLRVSAVAFARDLLNDQRTDVGLYDGRFTLAKKVPIGAVGLDGGGVNISEDPLLNLVSPAFVGAFRTYLWKELNVTIQDPYVALAAMEGKWKDVGPRVEPGDTLVNAMRRNPELQVMFLGGWYDVLAGTVGAAEYGAEVRLPRDRVSVKAYHSGHMCYLGDATKQVGPDINSFIQKATRQ